MVETNHEYQIVTASPEAPLKLRWEEFLCSAPFATHYVTPDFFADPFAGRGKRFAVLAVSGERIDAVLTGIKTVNKIVSGMAVRPQTVFRTEVDRSSAASALVRGLSELAGAEDELITFHSWEPIDVLSSFGYEHNVASGSERVVMLDLTKGADELFREFSERRRTDLRKTMKQGQLEVKLLETEAELAELYEIHKDWNHRKGNVPDEFDSFRQTLKSEYRAIFLALNNDKIVAGTYLRFCEGSVVEYAANNSLAEFQKLRPNELLGWKAIEWACSSGFRKFSLGASHPFLVRFGGELYSSHRYQLDRTFLKRHKKREQISGLVLKTYLALPDSVRSRIKSVSAKV